MKFALLSALMLSAGLASAAPVNYTIESSHTYPSFEVSHLGLSMMRGRFDTTTGTVTLDSAAKKGEVNISIDAASINTGHAKRDEHLRSEDFFNVAKHPKLTFTSSKLNFSGDKLSSMAGELTLLGVTKPVTLTVSHFHCTTHPMLKKPVCGADLHTSIKRSDFGMTKSLPGVGDDIKIAIEVEALAP